MSTLTYTKTGNKATTAAKLDKKVFGLEVKNHDLLKQAYLAYLANGRLNLAITKKRGEVRGGGRKPWKQKGTGRARFGSSRNPIWRGGGITFGPTGNENYVIKMSTQTRRTAVKQALSLASEAGKLSVIETFDCKDGKVASTVKLINKMGLDKNVLLVVSVNDDLVKRATRNIDGIKAVAANHLNVFDILNADHIVLSQKSLPIISDWLGNTTVKPEAKNG